MTARAALAARRLTMPLLALAGLLFASCTGHRWHGTDVSGSVPALQFTMQRANDGRTVTAADYRGRLVLLYFGYTNCPDVCPMTLGNVGQVLRKLGPAAQQVRVLFVTVDPVRDTLPVLKTYVAAFAPEVDGLRGDANQLTALARRYRVAYSVRPAKGDQPYEVTHSSAIYVFDRAGKARLLLSSLSTDQPDIAGTAADLKALL